MLFQIKKKSAPIEKSGDAQYSNTGESPFYSFNTVLFSDNIGSEKEPKFKYRTGMEPGSVLRNKLILDSEKEELEKVAVKLREIVKINFPGSENSENSFFWNPERTAKEFSHKDSMVVYDTDDPEGALLYLNILGGGYPMIAANVRTAEDKTGMDLYVIELSEQDEKESRDLYGDRLEAYAELNDLLNNKGIDSLLYISYLTSDTNKGRTKNTSKAQFQKDLMNYIEGSQNTVDKKKASKNFLTRAKQWKTNKDDLVLEASLEIGLWFGLVYKDKETKRLVLTNSKFLLGSDVPQSMVILNKPENHTELKDFIDQVNEKLKG